ncbi:MAG: hypothetical protein IJ659_06000 [Alloprevotella sp.]|nr:hypothetical protein [Alloprevotella sp.]
MKRTYFNIAKGTLLGAFLLLGAASCSDDHFDVVPDTATGGLTLWENISSNGETNDMAQILRRTIVMNSETDMKGYRNGSMLTYDSFLSDPQSYTVWAPKDGTYDPSKYLQMLDQRDEAFAADPNSREAWALNYTVANQFVMNHIARFNYEGTRERQKVRMLNSKVSYYEASNNLFNTVQMDRSAGDLNASNGILHFLTGASPFAYNIYDYIASHENFSKLWSVLSDPAVDRQEFSESGSTEGAIDENGNMIFVDSAFVHYNDILDYCGAQIRNEDSVYVALLPTDNAWDEAFEKVKSLYKYGNSYAYNWERNKGEFSSTGANALRFNTDSLTEYNTNMAIIQSAFFTSSRFPVDIQTDSAQVVSYALTADSLISTNGTVYYNPNTGGNNPIFDGKDPIRASNGYIFAVDQYNVDPAYSFISKNDFNLAFGNYHVANAKGTTGTEPQSWSELIQLTSENRNEEVKGEIEDDTYRRFEVNGRSNMTVDIRLPNILSGKYKISVVMLPNRVNLGKIRYDRNGEEINESTMFTCQVRDDLDQPIGSASPTITVDPDTIQSYVLFESIEFPKCYVGLPEGYDSFPRLRFTMSPAFQTRGNSNSLNIGRIIIEPVRE